MDGFNSKYWSDYFKRIFCQQITLLVNSIENRVLPTFDQIEAEAEDAVNREWERLDKTSCEYSDAGDMAALSQEAGIDYYISLMEVRQSLLNITTAALYHMFEQQVLYFHRKQILRLEEENDIKVIKIEEFVRRLKGDGIYIEKEISSWLKIEELKFVANAIKHAEGFSAKEVRRLRPDLFDTADISSKEMFLNLSMKRKPDVYMPLAGQDIYLSVKDLNDYSSALVSFWNELASIISSKEET